MRLNYCRQALAYFDRDKTFSAHEEIRNRHINIIKGSEKFILPDGGKTLDNSVLSVLNKEELIKLPFQHVALEYDATCLTKRLLPHQDQCTKRILLVRDDDGYLFMSGVWFYDTRGQWSVTPWMGISKDQFVNVEPKGGMFKGLLMPYGDWSKAIIKNEKLAQSVRNDIADEVIVVANFMSSLACNNVDIEKKPAASIYKRKKKAIPYDDYWITTIRSRGGSKSSNQSCEDRRSPREHLRRGHIRRLQNGHNIWVNACVINAGIGGRVEKDYAISAG